MRGNLFSADRGRLIPVAEGHVVGSGGEWGYSFPDWAHRLLSPHPNGNGHAWGVGVDTADAELALAVNRTP